VNLQTTNPGVAISRLPELDEASFGAQFPLHSPTRNKTLAESRLLTQNPQPDFPEKREKSNPSYNLLKSFRPANEVKMLFLKSSDKKSITKPTYTNIPHAKFNNSVLQNGDATPQQISQKQYQMYLQSLLAPTDLMTRTNFVADMLSAEKKIELTNLKRRKDVSFLKDRDKKLLTNFGTAEYKSDYLPEKNLTSEDLRQILVKSDFKMLNQENLVSFDDLSALNEDVITSVYKEQVQNLESKIMSTELETYLNRTKLEKIPASRVDIIE
jgi:hypothetical protein